MKKMVILLFLFLLALTIYGVRLAVRTPQRFQWSVKWACRVYGIASVGLWLILYSAGDQWWLATVFLFGPSWIWLVPLIPLSIAALLVHPRSLWLLLMTAWVVLFPVMGFQVPWRLMISRPNEVPRIRIMTCNLHELSADSLAAFVKSIQPDVVVVQEWVKPKHSVFIGDGTWYTSENGELFVASRFPIRRVKDLGAQYWAGPGSAACYDLEMPDGIVSFINLRLASPHPQLEDLRWHSPLAPLGIKANSTLRRKQSEIISRYADKLGPKTFVAGDLNTPHGSKLFQQYWLRVHNAFSAAGWGFGCTYIAPWFAIRIDHIFAGPAWRCRRCWVGPDVGYPHRPLIADFERVEQQTK